MSDMLSDILGKGSSPPESSEGRKAHPCETVR
jgi:hypothetical protein